MLHKFWVGFRPGLGPGTCPTAPVLKTPQNQRTLAREIDAKAPRKLTSKIWPAVQVSKNQFNVTQSPLCYAIVLPGRKSAFRAGIWPDCYRGSTEIGRPAGRPPAGGPISVFSRQQSSQNPAQKADIRPGSIVA